MCKIYQQINELVNIEINKSGFKSSIRQGTSRKISDKDMQHNYFIKSTRNKGIPLESNHFAKKVD